MACPIAILVQDDDLVMSESQQELLREAWLGGRLGTLSAMSEAKAWALREMWRVQEKSDYGLAT